MTGPIIKDRIAALEDEVAEMRRERDEAIALLREVFVANVIGSGDFLDVNNGVYAWEERRDAALARLETGK